MANKFEKIYGTLVYVQLSQPVKAYVKPGFPAKPDEWKASIVLTDEDYVDELEDYAKSLDTQLSLKKVKTAEFKSKYNIDPPEDAGKNVWILTLRKSTELGKTGKPVPEKHQPRVFHVSKGKLLDITAIKLVGNGSKGALSVDRFDRTAGGSSLYLKHVLVNDLIEYVKEDNASGYEAGDEFLADIADDGEGNEVKVPESAKENKVSKPKQQKQEEPVDDDDPF